MIFSFWYCCFYFFNKEIKKYEFESDIDFFCCEVLLPVRPLNKKKKQINIYIH